MQQGHRAVAESSFLIEANGAPDAPPASALRDWLVAHGARSVTAVHHPLTAEEGGRHEVVTYAAGHGRRRTVRLPSRPPATYPLDLLVPLRTPPVDVWFGFTNVACARGLAARAAGRAGKVVLWSVDFVPDRFGDGALTRIYDSLDAYCCRHADGRVELSAAAAAGRDARHGIGPGESAPTQIVPIGAWIARLPKVPESAIDDRRVVFIGHLVERMGVALALDAVALLARRGVEVTLDIAGRGPLEDELRRRARELGLERRVHFHGFLSDHRELERLLATGAIGLAPYDTRGESFTRFADPSKLKSYLGAGLPVLLTDVPPNAGELAADGGAEILPFEAPAWADAIERVLGDREEWRRRRAAALAHARLYDWETIVAHAVERLGFF